LFAYVVEIKQVAWRFFCSQKDTKNTVQIQGKSELL